MNGKSDINERLQDIEETMLSTGGMASRTIYLFEEDVQWMHDTIKQQQEEIERLKSKKAEAGKVIAGWSKLSSRQDQRITELEKERREITAAHEAFLREVEYSVNLEIVYNKHFYELVHLAEQVRKAKLSAGVEE